MQRVPFPQLPAEPQHPLSDYSIRVLTAPEIQTLEPEFKAAGVSLPDPERSTFVGAFWDGAIVAFECIQLRLFADPIRVDPAHSRVYRSLVHFAQRLIESTTFGEVDVYVHAPIGTNQERLAEIEGMVKQPYSVYCKRLQGQFVPPADMDPADFGYADAVLEPQPDIAVLREEMEKHEPELEPIAMMESIEPINESVN